MQVNDDTPAEWRFTRTVSGRDEATGDEVPVVVGLRETTASGMQVALRVGERTVVLALNDAGQLELGVRDALVERFRMTIRALGGEQP